MTADCDCPDCSTASVWGWSWGSCWVCGWLKRVSRSHRHKCTEDTPQADKEVEELRALVAEAEKTPRPISDHETPSGTPSLRLVPQADKEKP